MTCSIKKAGKCNCGSLGKKLIRIPYPYKNIERVVQRSRKWKKKHGIEIVLGARMKYEGY